MAELEAEFAIGIGVNEIITSLVHDVDATAFELSRADAIKGRPQVDIDDHHSEELTVGSEYRSGRADRRQMRCLDHTVFLVELDRRDIDLPRSQAHGTLDIIAFAVT